MLLSQHMIQELDEDLDIAKAFLEANADEEGQEMLTKIEYYSHIIPCFIDTMLRRLLVRALCLRLKVSDKAPLERFLTKIDDYPKWLGLTRE